MRRAIASPRIVNQPSRRVTSLQCTKPGKTNASRPLPLTVAVKKSHTDPFVSSASFAQATLEILRQFGQLVHRPSLKLGFGEWLVTQELAKQFDCANDFAFLPAFLPGLFLPRPNVALELQACFVEAALVGVASDHLEHSGCFGKDGQTQFRITLAGSNLLDQSADRHPCLLVNLRG